MYIYIYIYTFFRKKPKTSYFRIINLFPSCFFVSGVNQKHEEKYNRTSSDLMDKKNQNRHGWGKEWNMG